jgi:hypothetical protein
MLTSAYCVQVKDLTIRMQLSPHVYRSATVPQLYNVHAECDQKIPVFCVVEILRVSLQGLQEYMWAIGMLGFWTDHLIAP